MSHTDDDATDRFDPEAVLDFWFEDAARDPAAAKKRSAVWYGGSQELDREIEARFGPWIERAAAGKLDAWHDDPRGRLASIILLDQFPRNTARGTSAAFAHDASALELAREGVALGHLEALQPIEQVFLLMPYQHVEDLAAQREGLAHFERIAREASAEWRPLLESNLDWARRHLQLVERFGRFPHRNEVLGRTPTAAEKRYLEEGGERFGQ